MESFGNERKIQQGEDWNLDILLSSSNREYIPYIISSERPNPFFVITVASTKYEKNLRYVKSWWNSIKDSGIPTFFQTVPEEYDLEANDNEIPDYCDLSVGDFEEIQGVDEGDTIYDCYTFDDSTLEWTYHEEVTVDISETYYKLRNALHYYVNDGETRYFYYDIPSKTSGKFALVKGYECHVRMNFQSSETRKWGGQNYMYQITLVSGELMPNTLNSIYLKHKNLGEDVSDWPVLPEETDPEYDTQLLAEFNYVKTMWPNELEPDIDSDSPLGYIETPEPILPPTKLEVFNNLRIII